MKSDDAMADYLAGVQERLGRPLSTQREAMDSAAERVAETFARGGWLYVFGTGHSHMLAEELFFRAGGSPRVRPMLLDDLMFHRSASESTERERELGRAALILERYPVSGIDVLIVASNSGRNAVPIELASKAKERGTFTVALTSLAHAQAFPARHPSGRRLHEVVDLVLDHGAPAGDASVSLGNDVLTAGAVSTVLGAAMLQMIHVGAMERLIAQGRVPELFVSSNADGGRSNRILLEKYRPQVSHL